MAKLVTVTLYRPDGGTARSFDDVEIISYTKDTIEFTKRTENNAVAFEGEETVTVTDYTSNLPYLIVEAVTGPKNLI